MHSEEFDKLIKGEPAKWLPIRETVGLKTKEQLIEEINKNQVNVPKETQNEVHEFILKLMKLKVKKLEIRRRVKERFNISLVKK